MRFRKENAVDVLIRQAIHNIMQLVAFIVGPICDESPISGDEVTNFLIPIHNCLHGAKSVYSNSTLLDVGLIFNWSLLCEK